MKPNILFVVIDSFRADKAQGENRTCKTPNIDKLVKNGTYFEQAITSSDATPLSIRSIFTSLLPFKTGTVFQPKTDQGIKSIIDFLKNEGYNLYATVPNFKHVEFLYSSFENEDKFIEIEKNWPRLDEGLGDKIIKKISSLKQPWFYYIHPLDIHAKVLPGTSSIKIPKKFVIPASCVKTFEKIFPSFHHTNIFKFPQTSKKNVEEFWGNPISHSLHLTASFSFCCKYPFEQQGQVKIFSIFILFKFHDLSFKPYY